MTLTFAEIHNMIAYLIKSDASEGFNQIIDFLNRSSIKYALTVNPNIYVSCIKQFWTTVAVKKVNDIIRLQALVDKKKVVVMEATIRDALRLDDSEGVECKGFSGVKTPLFKGMIVDQQVAKGDADEVHGEDVNAAGVVTKDKLMLPSQVKTAELRLLRYSVVADTRLKKWLNEKYARELEVEFNKTIDWDEVIDHVNKKAKEDNAVKRYQAIKRKPHTEAQARKNMMIYLKIVAGFKMNYFKGMSYDDIRPVFEKYFDSNVAFLQKTKEQMDEEDIRPLKRPNESKEEKAAKKQKLEEEVEELKRHLQIMDEEDIRPLKRPNESKEEKAAKKQKLEEEVEELKRHLQIVPNEKDDVYTKATPLARKVPVVDYEIYVDIIFFIGH
uniref:Xylulose kinase-1 n=1 Tax=Tanacetum cinerariifolium TaxID=118510 RepID=A0A6L2KZM0_TANCI|nr:xylulose kinase-1 [Tanacetum cinerariifolium]